jgi:hypothetical protein
MLPAWRDRSGLQRAVGFFFALNSNTIPDLSLELHPSFRSTMTDAMQPAPARGDAHHEELQEGRRVYFSTS